MTEPSPDTEQLVAMRVDHERCIGSGMCEMLAEHVFVLDDDTNVAGVVAESRLDHKTALEVVDRCPSSAISIDQSDEMPK